MLPVTLLGLTTVLVAQRAMATAPVCASSAYSLSVDMATFLSNTYCGELQAQGFNTYQSWYNGPWASFNFTKGTGTCDSWTCSSSLKNIVNGCDVRDNNIYGGGSFDAGCGVFDFTLWNPSVSPEPIGDGQATSTVTVHSFEFTTSTISGTAAGTSTHIPTASSVPITSSSPPPTPTPSRSSPSPPPPPSTSSSSSLPTSSSSSSVPASSSTVSSTTSSVATKESSVSLTMPQTFSNSSSNATAPISSSSNANSSVVPSNSSSNGTTPTLVGVVPSTNTPIVLQNSAGAFQASGYSLLGVALLFGFVI